MSKKFIKGLSVLLVIVCISAIGANASGVRKATPSILQANDTPPKGSYDLLESFPLHYTYYQSFSFSEGDQITIESKAVEGTNTNGDTVMHLFGLDYDNGSISYYDDDSGDGYYSKLIITIPITGQYQLLVRSYNGNQQKCDIYLNNQKIAEEAQVAGKLIRNSVSMASHKTYSFFTANNEGDTTIWTLNSSYKVMGFNDDGESLGDFDWGVKSRLDHKKQDISYVVVGRSNKETFSIQKANTDVYLALKKYAFEKKDDPSLHPYDALVSAPACEIVFYNCYAYAGGITTNFIVPHYQSSPWYVENNHKKSFDNYLGNNPPRYAGAMSYIPTSNSQESVVDLHMENSDYTHLAVKKPGNWMAHGYSWESKLGSLERIFHPRGALLDMYGSIVAYYKVNNSVSMSFKESVENNLTQVQSVEISENVKKILAENKQAKQGAFAKHYDNWKDSINNLNLLTVITTSQTNSNQYKNLESFIKNEGKNCWLTIINNYLDTPDICSLHLLEKYIICYDDNTKGLIGRIRERHNKISSESMKNSVYLAPSAEANINAFINSIVLNDLN